MRALTLFSFLFLISACNEPECINCELQSGKRERYCGDCYSEGAKTKHFVRESLDARIHTVQEELRMRSKASEAPECAWSSTHWEEL